jgi:hypothetical protein
MSSLKFYLDEIHEKNRNATSKHPTFNAHLGCVHHSIDNYLSYQCKPSMFNDPIEDRDCISSRTPDELRRMRIPHGLFNAIGITNFIHLIRSYYTTKEERTWERMVKWVEYFSGNDALLDKMCSVIVDSLHPSRDFMDFITCCFRKIRNCVKHRMGMLRFLWSCLKRTVFTYHADLQKQHTILGYMIHHELSEMDNVPHCEDEDRPLFCTLDKPTLLEKFIK